MGTHALSFRLPLRGVMKEGPECVQNQIKLLQFCNSCSLRCSLVYLIFWPGMRELCGGTLTVGMVRQK